MGLTIKLLMRTISCIAPDKVGFFNQKVLIFFLFLHKNICCEYSLEAPRRSTSNEYHKICFHGKTCGYPLLSEAMAIMYAFVQK